LLTNLLDSKSQTDRRAPSVSDLGLGRSPAPSRCRVSHCGQRESRDHLRRRAAGPVGVLGCSRSLSPVHGRWRSQVTTGQQTRLSPLPDTSSSVHRGVAILSRIRSASSGSRARTARFFPRHRIQRTAPRRTAGSSPVHCRIAASISESDRDGRTCLRRGVSIADQEHSGSTVSMHPSPHHSRRQ
jgi:hypothetical protein